MKRNNKWPGYTLEELRYQRALAAAQTMIEENRLHNSIDDLRAHFERPAVKSNGLVSRMLSSVGTLDWIVLAVSLFRKFAPLFRR